MKLGDKIVVVGVSASGKTTFANKLAKRLNLPLLQMDEVQWRPGWEEVPSEEVVVTINKFSEQSSWVIEGYITSAARAGLFTTADTIVYLDYPGWLSAWRYLKRWFKYRKEPRPELPGSPERFSFKFLWLVYTKGEAKKLEELFTQKPNINSKVVRVKGPKLADRLLEKL